MKKVLFFLFVLLSTCAFAQSDDPALKSQSDVIRFETIPGRNTGVREANMFDALKDAKVSRLESYAASGTNTYTLTVPWLTSYKTNAQLAIYFANANTGASTINVNSFGAKSIVTNSGSALIGGELKGYVELIYDGTNFQIAWTSSIAGGSHFLIVDNSTLQLDIGTSYNGAADRTISIKNGGVTNAKLANSSVTISGNSVSLGGSVTQDQITGLSSTGLIKRTSANTLAIASAGTDYLAPSGSGAGLSGVWLLASGGTLTGANTITGTTSNTLKFVFNSLAATQTDGAGLWLQNSTAAINGTQQDSPAITWEGQGFATTPAVSQTVKFIADILPTQSATIPIGSWRLRGSVNGAAYSDILVVTTAGSMVFTSGGSTLNFTGSNINASVGTLNLSTAGTARISITNTGTTFTQGALAASWVPMVTETPGAHTNMTASTEFISRDFQGAIQQWATGALTTQRWNYFKGYTAAFVGASTLTDAYTLYVDPPVAGTNATITNIWAAGFNGSTKIVGASGLGYMILNSGGAIQGIRQSSTAKTLDIGAFTGGGNQGNINFVDNNGGVTYARFSPSGTSTAFAFGTATTTNAFSYWLQPAMTSGWSPALRIDAGAHTGITASTELLGSISNHSAVTQQWATGTLATQRFNYFGAPTVAFVGASTATDVYNVFIEGPISGTNATITNPYALGGKGGIFFTDLAGTKNLLKIPNNGAQLVSSANGLQIQTNGSAVGGISLNGATPASNTITYSAPGFSISTGGNFNIAGTAIVLSGGSAINPTSGSFLINGITGTFNPTSGTATLSIVNIIPVINQTGGANGSITYLDINPTRTAVIGTEYSVMARYGLSGFGLGASLPTARLHVAGGTATAGTASVKINSGVLLSSTEAGALENDGTHLYFTFANSGTRYQLDQQSGGITNSAANNELMKSNGTNAVSSGLFSSTSGNLDLGTTSLSGDRTINAQSSSSNSSIIFNGNFSSSNIEFMRLSPNSDTGGAGIEIVPTNQWFSIKTANNNTNSTFPALYLYGNPSGTVASGYGLRIDMKSLNVSGQTSQAATITAAYTDVTASSQDTDLIFSTATNGTSTTEKLRLLSTGAIAFSGSTNYGSSGQFLTSNGGSSAPTWSSPISGSTDMVPVFTSSTSIGSSEIRRLTSTNYYLQGNTNGILQFGSLNSSTGSSAQGIVYAAAGSSSLLLKSYSENNASPGLGELTNFATNGALILKTSISGLESARQGFCGKKVTLTEGTATVVASVTINSTLTSTGGEIIVSIEAGDGSDIQNVTHRIAFNIINKSGVLTIATGTPESVTSTSTGTLTDTVTFVDAGSGVMQIKVNATSSLTQTFLRAQCTVIKNLDGSIGF